MVNLQNQCKNVEEWLEQKVEKRCITCETMQREMYLKCRLLGEEQRFKYHYYLADFG